MSSLTHPVGPERPEVYWRRRVTLAGGVVVLVALAAFGLSRIGGDDASAAAPAGESEPPAGDDAPDEAPESAEAPPEPEACKAESLQVVATADAGSYPEDATPQVGVTVRNNGEQGCLVDLGEPGVTLLVVSGADRIWSSDDCETDAAAAPIEVEPAGEQSVTAEWPRLRSAEGCPSDLPEPRPGTYQLTAAVAGVTSAPVSFTLE